MKYYYTKTRNWKGSFGVWLLLLIATKLLGGRTDIYFDSKFWLASSNQKKVNWLHRIYKGLEKKTQGIVYLEEGEAKDYGISS